MMALPPTQPADCSISKRMQTTAYGNNLWGRQRQQQAARDERSKDLTSYERKEKEWQSADITTSDGGGDLGGGIGNWLAKQNNN